MNESDSNGNSGISVAGWIETRSTKLPVFPMTMVQWRAALSVLEFDANVHDDDLAGVNVKRIAHVVLDQGESGSYSVSRFVLSNATREAFFDIDEPICILTQHGEPKIYKSLDSVRSDFMRVLKDSADEGELCVVNIEVSEKIPKNKS